MPLRSVLAGLFALVGAGLLVVAAVVLRGGGDDADGTAEAVAPGGRTSTSPADPVGSPATATSAVERVVLRPDGLGVVDFGASPAHTYAALTEALGVSGFNHNVGSSETGGPYQCVGSAASTGVEQAVWGGRLVVLSSEDAGFFAWRYLVSINFTPLGELSDLDLSTPEGLGSGATTQDFEQTYGPTTSTRETFSLDLDFLAPGPSEFDHLTSATGFDALVVSGEMALFGATGEDPADVCTSAGGHA